MIDRAEETLAPEKNDRGAAVLTITVANFPGLCMGASVLMSLGLARVGFGALTENEGAALAAALLKNVEAWGGADVLAKQPKIAAGFDLVGVLVAILAPRIIADLNRRPPSPTQAAAAARDEAEAATA